MSKVKTKHVYPPIPIRDFDWCAFFEDDEGYEDACIGWGATEEQAIAALMENVNE